MFGNIKVTRYRHNSQKMGRGRIVSKLQSDGRIQAVAVASNTNCVLKRPLSKGALRPQLLVAPDIGQGPPGSRVLLLPELLSLGSTEPDSYPSVS